MTGVAGSVVQVPYRPRPAIPSACARGPEPPIAYRPWRTLDSRVSLGALAAEAPACGTLAIMSYDAQPGIVDRLSRQGEEALGRMAEDLIANPVVSGAISRALDAREKAAQAQEAAMGALNIPSAADVERLTRRLRSVSQRLEGIEDALDRLEERTASAASAAEAGAAEERSGAEELEARLQSRLDEIARDLADLREALIPNAELPPRSQERLTVGEAAAGRPSRPGVRLGAAGS